MRAKKQYKKGKKKKNIYFQQYDCKKPSVTQTEIQNKYHKNTNNNNITNQYYQTNKYNSLLSKTILKNKQNFGKSISRFSMHSGNSLLNLNNTQNISISNNMVIKNIKNQNQSSWSSKHTCFSHKPQFVYKKKLLQLHIDHMLYEQNKKQSLYKQFQKNFATQNINTSPIYLPSQLYSPNYKNFKQQSTLKKYINPQSQNKVQLSNKKINTSFQNQSSEFNSCFVQEHNRSSNILINNQQQNDCQLINDSNRESIDCNSSLIAIQETIKQQQQDVSFFTKKKAIMIKSFFNIFERTQQTPYIEMLEPANQIKSTQKLSKIIHQTYIQMRQACLNKRLKL